MPEDKKQTSAEPEFIFNEITEPTEQQQVIDELLTCTLPMEFLELLKEEMLDTLKHWVFEKRRANPDEGLSDDHQMLVLQHSSADCYLALYKHLYSDHFGSSMESVTSFKLWPSVEELNARAVFQRFHENKSDPCISIDEKYPNVVITAFRGCLQGIQLDFINFGLETAKKRAKKAKPDPIYREETNQEKLGKEIEAALRECPMLLEFLQMTQEEFLDKCQCRALAKEEPMHQGFCSQEHLLLVSGPFDHYLAVDFGYFEDVASSMVTTIEFGVLQIFDKDESLTPEYVFTKFKQDSTPRVRWVRERPETPQLNFQGWLTPVHARFLKLALKSVL